MEHICEQCGEDFSEPGNRPRRFCSRACYELGRTERVTKTCPVCNKPFTVSTKVADRFTVCSWECRTAGTTYADCPRCGKRFNNKRGIMKHCSEECRRPAFLMDCENCGATFRRVPSDTDRRFCCFACYRSFTGETTPERLVREALDAANLDYQREWRVGRYSLDFAVLSVLLNIEVDGDYWHSDPAKDQRRDETLKAFGWTTLRLSESKIHELDDRLSAFLAHELAKRDASVEAGFFDDLYPPELFPAYVQRKSASTVRM